MMTREDMLRELELLPVWQLRAPVQLQPQPAETAPVVNPIIAVPAKIPGAQNAFNLTLSADKKWALIMPASPELPALQSSLFNNILLALKIDKTNKIVLTSFVDIEAKVIIAMGETTAQQLLNSAESIESLRGKTHTFENIPLIVTYHPHDMLQNLANKAKTWDDLCMAMEIMRA
jgi:DNA polymerase